MSTGTIEYLNCPLCTLPNYTSDEDIQLKLMLTCELQHIMCQICFERWAKKCKDDGKEPWCPSCRRPFLLLRPRIDRTVDEFNRVVRQYCLLRDKSQKQTSQLKTKIMHAEQNLRCHQREISTYQHKLEHLKVQNTKLNKKIEESLLIIDHLSQQNKQLKQKLHQKYEKSAVSPQFWQWYQFNNKLQSLRKNNFEIRKKKRYLLAEIDDNRVKIRRLLHQNESRQANQLRQKNQQIGLKLKELTSQLNQNIKESQTLWQKASS